MKVVSKKLSEIKPYGNNPRKNDEAVDYVANSIKKFGFQQPIVVDSEGVIIVGHTRYKASQKLKLDTVPIVVADNLTPEQVKAYRLADNKTAEFSGWDFTLLEDELNSLDGFFDMGDFGFLESAEFDPESFFEESAGDEEEKKPETVTCPHCGKTFEL